MARITNKAYHAPLPSLLYETIDAHSYGDQMYERRLINSGKHEGIYVYSQRTKEWYPYTKTNIQQKWDSIKGLKNV